MRRWALVHNDSRGLPARALQYIDELRKGNEDVVIETWGEPELLQLKERLGLEALEALFGPVPTSGEGGSLGMDDLQPVINALQRMEPVSGEEPLVPPTQEKLERNALSADATELLQWGRRKEQLVERFFATDPRPDLGERVAEAFREHYGSLRDRGLSPDEILWELQAHAGGDQVGLPQRQGAVLAVLSYFFERCDIFEDPRSAQ